MTAAVPSIVAELTDAERAIVQAVAAWLRQCSADVHVRADAERFVLEAGVAPTREASEVQDRVRDVRSNLSYRRRVLVTFPLDAAVGFFEIAPADNRSATRAPVPCPPRAGACPPTGDAA